MSCSEKFHSLNATLATQPNFGQRITTKRNDMKLARRQRDDRGALANRGTGDGGPFNQLSRLRSEINRIFEDPLSILAPSTSFFQGWEPTVDIYEDKNKITVRAELPGMRKEDINISLERDILILSGERKQEEKRAQGDTYRAELFYGRFQRSITLPQPVDASKIQAVYKDGVLTIVCPKSEEAKRKQIEVKTS
jgi:HSP20 family protein